MKPYNVVDIVSDGDIILDISRPIDGGLRISSAVLCATSPVFNTMLSSPNFSEGQGQAHRSSSSPQHILLPEDKLEAMSDMCHLLHHKTDHAIEDKLGAKRLHQLAVTVDKYQCAPALKLQGQGLLYNHLESQSDVVTGYTDELTMAAATAYIFDSHRDFKIATHRLIVRSIEPISKDRFVKSCHIFDGHDNALLTMAERQSEAARAIMAELPLRVASRQCPEQCDEIERALQNELTVIFDIPYWPPNVLGSMGKGMSIAQALDILKGADDILADGPPCDHVGNSNMVATTGNLQEFVSTIKGECVGLCLRCFKDGRKEKFKAWCGDKSHPRLGGG